MEGLEEPEPASVRFAAQRQATGTAGMGAKQPSGSKWVCNDWAEPL